MKKIWNWLCGKIGLCIILYRPDGNIRLSIKATILLKNMPNINLDDLEKWFKETQISIGSNTILTYLIYKEKREKKNGACK